MTIIYIVVYLQQFLIDISGPRDVLYHPSRHRAVHRARRWV